MSDTEDEYMPLEADHDAGDGRSILICPACGGADLRHDTVAVFDRYEDEVEETETKVRRGGNVSVQRVPAAGSGNPSDRRHGLAVAFTCEACPFQGELTVAQHKGATLVGWRVPERGG